MKIKRSIGVPAALLLYLVVISIYAWPGRGSGVTYPQWIAIFLITLVCIVILYFLLKRRDKYRNKNNMDENKKQK